MECKHAYLKSGVNYVLCKCQGEPKSLKMQDVTPCMCGHQRFCPQIQHCTLLPTWQNCLVKRQAEKKTVVAFEEEDEKVEEPAPKPKRTSRKRKQ